MGSGDFGVCKAILLGRIGRVELPSKIVPAIVGIIAIPIITRIRNMNFDI